MEPQDPRDAAYTRLANTRRAAYTATTTLAISLGTACILGIPQSICLALGIATSTAISTWTFCSGRCLGYREGLNDERSYNETTH
jgi:hypothetical protein